MGVSPSGRGGGGGGVIGSGDLSLPPPEHSRTVHWDQAHYGTVSGSGEAPGVTDIQAVVGSGRPGLVGCVYGSFGGGTGVGEVGYGWDEDRDRRLIRWEVTVANAILGKEPYSLPAYAPVLELHHMIMSMIGGTGGRLEIERGI